MSSKDILERARFLHNSCSMSKEDAATQAVSELQDEDLIQTYILFDITQDDFIKSVAKHI